MTYLSGDYDDLEQLQAQLKGLAALGIKFITRTHEEVFQLPAKGLISLIISGPVSWAICGELVVGMAVAMTVNVMAMLVTTLRGAVATH